jgi:uncharacterized protein (TIGR02246 family)
MKLRLAATLTSALVLIANCLIVDAQQAQVTDVGSKNAAAVDENAAAIRQNASAFVEAFNRGDAKGVAALWTDNGEYVDESGNAYVGREAIEKCYADFFKANPGASLLLEVDSVRLLSADAAIEDGRAMLKLPPDDASTVSVYSVVHVKVDGKWLMASVRDARTDSGTAYEHISDLEWLIGTWTAEEQGVKTESVCKWIGDKSFVERRYTTKATDGAETTGVQIIGWNAQAGRVQSWNFSADGSFAHGVWSPTAGGWRASVSGVTVNGATTSAVNHLHRLDDNAYVWQSVDRSLGDAALPDSDEVIMRRSPQK